MLSFFIILGLKYSYRAWITTWKYFLGRLLGKNYFRHLLFIYSFRWRQNKSAIFDGVLHPHTHFKIKNLPPPEELCIICNEYYLKLHEDIWWKWEYILIFDYQSRRQNDWLPKDWRNRQRAETMRNSFIVFATI